MKSRTRPRGQGQSPVSRNGQCLGDRVFSASVEREFERRAKHKLAVLRHVDEAQGTSSTFCGCSATYTFTSARE